MIKKKILITLVLFVFCSPVFALDEFNYFTNFYTYNGQKWVFHPLTKEEQKDLTTREAKKAYK
ncbi:MAG: hypothetical protein LBL38_02420, partial [Lactobacillales bacterium]|nr:hypothetical protein [Lactobacillales bacterium]